MALIRQSATATAALQLLRLALPCLAHPLFTLAPARPPRTAPASAGALPPSRRLRGHAVCRAWRSALQELPYPAWRIATDTKGLAAELGWLVQARPSIRK